ncbi:MAG: hypothetical protein GX638_02835 [Crenarchaeota archaeon]|nr:hypothetical protein [Thermoproteota archaeon]
MAMQTSRSLDDRVSILKKVFKQIDAHAKNEDKNISRLIDQMKPEQITKIEQVCKQLGYKL